MWLLLRGRRRTWSTSSSLCVAGTRHLEHFGQPPRFAWQVQHLEHLRLRFAWQAQHLEQLRAHGAWQGQHLEHLHIEVGGSSGDEVIAFGHRLVLRGRRNTWSISGWFCVAGAALGASPGSCLRGRCSTWSTSGSFCVAGAALEASQLRIARHFFRAETIHTTPSTLHHQTQHHQHTHIIYTTSSNTTLSTHTHTPFAPHHQHNIINTTSSTHHHLHNTIDTTPATQHHQHNTMYTTSSNTGRCNTWSTAIVPLLPHSC